MAENTPTGTKKDDNPNLHGLWWRDAPRWTFAFLVRMLALIPGFMMVLCAVLWNGFEKLTELFEQAYDDCRGSVNWPAQKRILDAIDKMSAERLARVERKVRRL